MQPEKIYTEKGEIIINSTIIEEGFNSSLRNQEKKKKQKNKQTKKIRKKRKVKVVSVKIKI